MKILYQSDITGKTYESKEELIKAEEAISEAKKKEEIRKQERAKAAKEVQAKLDNARETQREAQEALANFCKEYGAFKTTLKRDDFFDPFSLFFDSFEF